MINHEHPKEVRAWLSKCGSIYESKEAAIRKDYETQLVKAISENMNPDSSTYHGINFICQNLNLIAKHLQGYPVKEIQ